MPYMRNNRISTITSIDNIGESRHLKFIEQNILISFISEKLYLYITYIFCNV